MRVSSDRNDPDYKGDAFYKVLLDGVEMKCVFEADDVAGTVVCEGASVADAWFRDTAIVAWTFGPIPTVTFAGRVEIIPIDVPPPDPSVVEQIEPVVWFDRAITDTEAVQLSKVHPSACIDPNAEMLQKDALGSIEQVRRDWEMAGKFIEGMRKALADMQPPEPGESLGIVAPMDHRLGRFKA